MSQDLIGGSKSGSNTGSGGFRGQLQGNLRSLMDPTTRPQGLAAFSQDPAAFQTVMKGYGDTASGKYLDFQNNPAVQNLLKTYNQQSQQGLDTAEAGIRSRFALAGQPSTGRSSPLLNAEEQAAVQSGQNRDALAAQSLFGLYGQERGNQLNALQGLQSSNLLPEQLLQQLAPLLAKSSSKQSKGYLNAIMSAVGALAAGAACWVAREVYGTESGEWLVFREWLLNEAPVWFRWLYLKHGEAFAGWLRQHPWAKVPVRWTMNLVVKERKTVWATQLEA